MCVSKGLEVHKWNASRGLDGGMSACCHASSQATFLSTAVLHRLLCLANTNSRFGYEPVLVEETERYFCSLVLCHEQEGFGVEASVCNLARPLCA